MDYTALVAAFPTAIVAAVAGAPNGLTATSQVYVSSENAPRVAQAAVEAWVRPDPELPAPVEENAAGPLLAHRFHVLVYGASVTEAARRAWANAIRAYFHGALPAAFSAVTDLVGFTVQDVLYDAHAGQGGAAGCVVVVDAIGKEFPA